MRTAFGPIAALLLSVAILLTGNGLQGTLLPIRAELEAFSIPSVGVLGSAYYVGFAAGCFLGARMVRRAGHIRVFIAMSSIASAVALAHALFVFAPFWWVIRAISGFCFAVLFVVIESWLNERSTNENRGIVMAVYLIINLTVMTLGQLMVTLYDPAGFALFALASMIVSLAAVPVAFTASEPPGPIETVHVRLRRLYSLSPVGFVGCLAVGLANGAFWALGPLFASAAGLGVTGIALFMSITVIAGAIGQWPLGRASDKIDRRKILAGACFGAGVAGILIALSLHGPAWYVVAAAPLFGLFAFPVYAIAAAHTNDFVDKAEFVEASSGLLLVFAAGAAAGPLLAAAVMHVAGPGGLYAYTACVHFAMGGFALWRMRLRERAPAEERTAFIEALEAASTVSNVFEAEILKEELAEAGEARESPAPSQAGSSGQSSSWGAGA